MPADPYILPKASKKENRSVQQVCSYKYPTEQVKSEKSELAVFSDPGADFGTYDLFLVGTCSGGGAH